ncbi:MAG: nitroreductase/quinone reductase family protein [Gammaproteobacteria bacterium]|nr:nitroreductase/quinone reductase family protein [Rhodospirillaceae bacterium]MDE0364746.1 nitroreductase/quinone reductase family protein [Gammaproteobacteria bacterium]
MATLEETILQEHIALYRSDPVAAHDLDSTRFGGEGLVPTLLLTTTGRRSGKQRLAPLLYQPSGRGFIVVASNGGAPGNPYWYTNLRFNPACTVQVGKILYRAGACMLARGERAPYWDWMVRMWPPYARYQELTEREIPVLALDPTEVLKIMA